MIEDNTAQGPDFAAIAVRFAQKKDQSLGTSPYRSGCVSVALDLLPKLHAAFQWISNQGHDIEVCDRAYAVMNGLPERPCSCGRDALLASLGEPFTPKT